MAIVFERSIHFTPQPAKQAIYLRDIGRAVGAARGADASWISATGE